MKVGRYEESLKESNELIERAEKIKGDFAEDYDIVASKFFVLHANINFIMKNYQVAIDAAKKGIELCAAPKLKEEQDLEIVRTVNNCRRDLLNALLRSTVKLDPSKKSSELRK